MRMLCALGGGIGLLVLLAGCEARPPAETEEAGAITPADDLLRTWNGEADKLIEMAEDFPEEKYDYRPTPEVRTFGDQLLHVASANYFFLHTARGASGEPKHLSHEEYQSKAAIVKALKESSAEVSAAIEQSGEAGLRQTVKHPFADRTLTRYGLWVAGLRNAAEHYGQLVVYYRNNRMVPPASRK